MRSLKHQNPLRWLRNNKLLKLQSASQNPSPNQLRPHPFSLKLKSLLRPPHNLRPHQKSSLWSMTSNANLSLKVKGRWSHQSKNIKARPPSLKSTPRNPWPMSPLRRDQSSPWSVLQSNPKKNRRRSPRNLSWKTSWSQSLNQSRSSMRHPKQN